MDETQGDSLSAADHERLQRVAVWEQTDMLVRTTPQLDPLACLDATEKFVHPPRELSTVANASGLTLPAAHFYQRITIAQRDCVDAALELTMAGRPPPLLMDAGSRGHFGGGYENGARAQEEELCRRSNLAHCVDPQHGQAAIFHPLEPTACIYSPSVAFFRAGVQADYAVYLHVDQGAVQSTTLAVGIVAATRNPVLVSGKLRADIAKNTQEAIANFLHCARVHGHRDVVLVPLGCGAYHNPPGHIVQLFDAALSEVLSDGKKLGECFDQIVFSVLDFPTGQPPVMTNNFCFFAHFFGSRGGRAVDSTGCAVDYRSLSSEP